MQLVQMQVLVSIHAIFPRRISESDKNGKMLPDNYTKMIIFFFKADFFFLFFLISSILKKINK